MNEMNLKNYEIDALRRIIADLKFFENGSVTLMPEVIKRTKGELIRIFEHHNLDLD